MSVPDRYIPDPRNLEPIDARLPGAYLDRSNGAAVFIVSEFHEAFGLADTAAGREETLAMFAALLRHHMPGMPIVARMPDGSHRDVP